MTTREEYHEMLRSRRMAMSASDTEHFKPTPMSAFAEKGKFWLETAFQNRPIEMQAIEAYIRYRIRTEGGAIG